MDVDGLSLSLREEMEEQRNVSVKESTAEWASGVVMVEGCGGEWVQVWGSFHAIISPGIPLKLPTVAAAGWSHITMFIIGPP